jgi:RNA polymerase sigma-70 factor, ECF subfamily
MSFDRLLREHEARVLRLAVRLTGNLADAQDSAQEVFMRLHNQLSQLSGPDSVPAWLHRVTVNVCFDLSRRRTVRRAQPLEGLQLVSSHPDPERQALAESQRDQLQAALGELSERERTAIVLRELEGLSTSEVAEVMGTAESTVRVQIANARLKLRGLLKGVRA